MVKKSNQKLLESQMPLTRRNMKALPHAKSALCPGIVSKAVVDLHKRPARSSELVNQTLVGTPVKILARKGGWILVETPEPYQGWMEASRVCSGPAVYSRWMRLQKVIVTAKRGSLSPDPKRRGAGALDVEAGSLLALTGETRVRFMIELPDGSCAAIRKNLVMPLFDWLRQTRATADAIVKTARWFLGVPYLWGGATSRALDCSGFVRLVFLLNGLLLRRDAHEQYRAGVPVKPGPAMSMVHPGDLLFFGQKRRKGTPVQCTHVGISLGGHRFIHASGSVHIASLDPLDPQFDSIRARTLLKVKRILGGKNTPGVLPVLKAAWLVPRNTMGRRKR